MSGTKGGSLGMRRICRNRRRIRKAYSIEIGETAGVKMLDDDIGISNLDADLLQKYNRPIPRYTSYPTAMEFRTIDDASSRSAFLADSGEVAGPISLYAHLPFCASLCWFCGCTKIVSTDQSIADKYLDYLEKETDRTRPYLGDDREVVQLHFGGGSPNFLSPEQIDRLGEILHRRFDFAEKAEMSVEIDPRTLTEEKVKAFVRMGINRASLGIQDLDPDVQKAIHRIQPTEMNRQAIGWLREAGIDSLNVDLIYGLPGQTVESFERTLAEVLDYDPDRFAIFSYAHIPWSKFAQKILERSRIPKPSVKIQLLALIAKTLTESGYAHIGMDHFTKYDDSLAVAQRHGALQRNFQGYSLHANTEICAFGISSISQTERTYRQNVKELSEYYRRLDAGELPIERGYMLSFEDRVRREAIMRLMCDMALGFGEMNERFDIDFGQRFRRELKALKPLEADGLVEQSEAGLIVTSLGRLLIRNIAFVFDAYSGHKEKTFSKSV